MKWLDNLIHFFTTIGPVTTNVIKGLEADKEAQRLRQEKAFKDNYGDIEILNHLDI
jgi:hypothetical protein